MDSSNNTAINESGLNVERKTLQMENVWKSIILNMKWKNGKVMKKFPNIRLLRP